ncbi:MAG TPA: TonB-dependent receptor [Pseudomonadales bacterium]
MNAALVTLACVAGSLVAVSAGAAAPDDEQLIEEMVVSAHPLSGEGLAQPTTLLDGQKLHEGLSSTLGETLINLPGVHSASFGAAVGRPVIHGLGGARVKVMEDRIDAMDVSVSSPDHAVTVDPFTAEHIEVIKGPSTLLYGTGAIGGVVDVHTGRIPHRIPETPDLKAELRAADNADRRAAAGAANLGLGSFAFHVDGFYRDADDYEIPGYAESQALRDLEEEDEGEQAYGVLPGSELETSGGALGGSLVGDWGFIGAAVSLYDATYGLPGGHVHDAGEEEEEHDEGSPMLDMDQTRFDLEAGFVDPFAGAKSLNLRLGYNEYEHQELEPSGEPGTRFQNEAIEGRIELTHQSIGGFDMAGGIQFGSRKYAASGEEAYVPPVDTDAWGIFYVAERSFPALDLEAGVRYEHVAHDPSEGGNRDFDLGAVSIGALVPFARDWTLAVFADYSTRAPAVEEIYSNGAHLATRTYEVGDPALDPERAANVTVTLQYESDVLLLAASAYYTDFSEFIYESYAGTEIDGLPVFEWQQADAEFYGVDLEARWTAISWDTGTLVLRGFYDYVRGRLKQGADTNLPRIPPQRGGIGAELSWHGLTASVDYARADDQDRTAAYELPTDGYDDLRAYLGWTIPWGESAVEVFVAGRNLTDDVQRYHTSFIKDFAPQPGRTLEAGLRLTL